MGSYFCSRKVEKLRYPKMADARIAPMCIDFPSEPKGMPATKSIVNRRKTKAATTMPAIVIPLAIRF